MNNDLISRSALQAVFENECFGLCDCCSHIKHNPEGCALIDNAPNVDVEPPVITGETSDGYHTFNELYYHRAVLFSVIVKAFPERAWKSRQHHDGTMYSGMFIVGIDTPEGQASYHYDIDPYWDMFECLELERAPEWDGHTPAQAIERISKLEPVRHGQWIQSKTVPSYHYCSRCRVPQKMKKSCNIYVYIHYCPNCGAKML